MKHYSGKFFSFDYPPEAKVKTRRGGRQFFIRLGKLTSINIELHSPGIANSLRMQWDYPPTRSGIRKKILPSVNVGEYRADVLAIAFSDSEGFACGKQICMHMRCDSSHVFITVDSEDDVQIEDYDPIWQSFEILEEAL